jgi:quercetin dioxygenase-like cupin family protein
MSMKSNDEARAVEMFPGVVRRTLTHADRTSLHELHLAKDSVVPLHTHPHEQTGYVASGRVVFQIGDTKRELKAGDGYSVPGEVPHGVVALEDSVCVDIFSPVREEYLDGA